MSGLEIIGLAAGVIQIADIGGKLSVKLFTFMRMTKNAESSIDALSRDIAATGAVLKQLGETLAKDDKLKLCSQEAIRTAKSLVDDTKDVFTNLESLIDGDEKSSIKSIGSISFRKKVKFSFLQPQIEQVQANLERLKSSLLVILNVLIFAEQLRSQETLPILKDQRELIKVLISEKDENEKRYEQLLKVITSQRDTQVVVTHIDLPPDLQQYQQRIQHHSELTQNLLSEVKDLKYDLDHGVRDRISSSVLNIHWNEWANHRRRHGQKWFEKLLAKHTDVARHWTDKKYLEEIDYPRSHASKVDHSRTRSNYRRKVPAMTQGGGKWASKEQNWQYRRQAGYRQSVVYISEGDSSSTASSFYRSSVLGERHGHDARNLELVPSFSGSRENARPPRVTQSASQDRRRRFRRHKFENSSSDTDHSASTKPFPTEMIDYSFDDSRTQNWIVPNGSKFKRAVKSHWREPGANQLNRTSPQIEEELSQLKMLDSRNLKKMSPTARSPRSYERNGSQSSISDEGNSVPSVSLSSEQMEQGLPPVPHDVSAEARGKLERLKTMERAQRDLAMSMCKGGDRRVVEYGQEVGPEATRTRIEEQEFNSRIEEKFMRAGYDEVDIDEILMAKNIKTDARAENVGMTAPRTPNILTESNENGLVIGADRPLYIRVQVKHLRPETLEFYALPWDYDPSDRDYILIKEYISHDFQQELFNHTRQINTRQIPLSVYDGYTKDTTTTLATVAKDGKLNYLVKRKPKSTLDEVDDLILHFTNVEKAELMEATGRKKDTQNKQSWMFT